jgi:hypothetical protein
VDPGDVEVLKDVFGKFGCDVGFLKPSINEKEVVGYKETTGTAAVAIGAKGAWLYDVVGTFLIGVVLMAILEFWRR